MLMTCVYMLNLFCSVYASQVVFLFFAKQVFPLMSAHLSNPYTIRPLAINKRMIVERI